MTRNPLLALIKRGIVSQKTMFPDLPEAAIGLPKLTESPCDGSKCGQCVGSCPTKAITVTDEVHVSLDRGLCIGCGVCISVCPSGTVVSDRSTRTATVTREALVLSSNPKAESTKATPPRPFLRSLHIREVSTGCSGTDQEVNVTGIPTFDVGRFGVHFVASPRYADALLVTGPVGKAMQEPLRRCYEAMAEPRIIIAVGTSAISGGIHRGGYAEANGVDSSYPIAAYVPGCPPHPWSIIHGILLAMGRELP